ncbi:MAG: acetolactate synthase small subunit [Tunicatimonas sp.]|uniref:acetolactate synthase small subunit n=1 Tax=Tunicatimonas sp. TaxID=1940096 RepID=UPI003C762048
MKRRYTIIVFTENNFGLLNRITIIFSRRRTNIESLTVSETERKGISRFTIVIDYDANKIQKLIQQIRKIIGVLFVFHNEDEQVFYGQIAYYKVATENFQQREEVMAIAHRHQAKVAFSTDDYIIIEKTGKKEDITTMLHLLEPHGILEFVKSGRIAVVKDQYRFSQYTKNIGPEGWYSDEEFHELKDPERGPGVSY